MHRATVFSKLSCPLTDRAVSTAKPTRSCDRRQSALDIAYIGTDYENEGWSGLRPNNFNLFEDPPDFPSKFHEDDSNRLNFSDINIDDSAVGTKHWKPKHKSEKYLAKKKLDICTL